MSSKCDDKYFLCNNSRDFYFFLYSTFFVVVLFAFGDQVFIVSNTPVWSCFSLEYEHLVSKIGLWFRLISIFKQVINIVFICALDSGCWLVMWSYLILQCSTCYAYESIKLSLCGIDFLHAKNIFINVVSICMLIIITFIFHIFVIISICT